MMKTNEAKIQVYQIKVCIIVTFHMVYSGLHSIYSLYAKNLKLEPYFLINKGPLEN